MASFPALKRFEKEGILIDYKPFDPADFLDDDDIISEYLKAAAEDANPDAYAIAKANVEKAMARTRSAEYHAYNYTK